MYRPGYGYHGAPIAGQQPALGLSILSCIAITFPPAENAAGAGQDNHVPLRVSLDAVVSATSR